MFLKLCLALAVAMVLYAVFVPNRAPAATKYDSYREDDVSVPGVVEIGLALSTKLKTDDAVRFDDLRIRSSPDGQHSVVCGHLHLPGSVSARFFGSGIGLGSRSTVPADFTPEFIGGTNDLDEEIEVLCYSVGF